MIFSKDKEGNNNAINKSSSEQTSNVKGLQAERLPKTGLKENINVGCIWNIDITRTNKSKDHLEASMGEDEKSFQSPTSDINSTVNCTTVHWEGSNDIITL